MTMKEHVDKFVEESGGIEKVDEVLASMTKLAENKDMRKFLVNISTDKEGANMLCSAAMMGFLLSSMIYKGRLH